MVDLYIELSDNSRRKLLIALYDGPKGVNALASITGLKQPNVSNHLSRLRNRGLVKADRRGREIIYALDGTEVERIVASLVSGSLEILPEPDMQELAARYARLAASGEEDLCAGIFETLFRAKTPLIDIYEGVVDPAMKMIGEWWKVGAIDEGQEHLATSITLSLLSRARHVAGTSATKNRRVIAGCAPGCHHLMGLSVVSDYLRFAGWRVFPLGTDVPHKAFANAIQLYHPDLVITNLQSDTALEPVLGLLSALSDARNKVGPFKIAVGGSQARPNRKLLLERGADFVPTSLREFAETIIPKIEQPNRSRSGALRFG